MKFVIINNMPVFVQKIIFELHVSMIKLIIFL